VRCPEEQLRVLTTTSSIITLRGRRLHVQADALTLHTVKSITEFSKELYSPLLLNDDQSYIEKSDIQLIKGAGVPQGAAAKRGSRHRIFTF
jgi:hypothetical protein